MTDDLVTRGREIARSGKYAAAGRETEVAPLAAQLSNALDNSEDGALLGQMFTAAELDTMTFPPLEEHIPGLVTEGFGILAGTPKAGKSWMTGGFALACAQGGTALGGISVKSRHVLLMALEDGQRRLQTRMRRLNHGQPLPKRLDILTTLVPGTVIAAMTDWLQRHRSDTNPPLVILDTLGRARPQRRAGDDPYIADYQLGSRLKAAIDAVPGAALLCVHHTRKMGAEDWLDTVSGTQGISGSADYILVLTRKRKSPEGVLAVTGRDIAENEYAIKTDDGIWALDGMDLLDASATVATRTEAAKQSRLSDRSIDATQFVNSRDVTTPAELAKHLDMDSRVAGNLLARLAEAGYITKAARGTYTPISSGESGESGEMPGQEPFPFSPPEPVSPLAGESGETESSSLAADSSLSPLSPPNVPPGAPTANTPGMTGAVFAALAKAGQR